MDTITPKQPAEGGEASRRERLRKEDPVRTAPIRNWSTLYRRSDSWDVREPSAPPAPEGEPGDGSWNDVVAHGVELGYRVIEEQIRQGQRIAEQLNHRAYNTGAAEGDLREVADRAWRYLTDLGALWIEFLSSLAGDSDVLRKLFGASPPQSASSTAASTNGAMAVSIEISCAARVMLDLRPNSERMRLVCRELRALDAVKPPLTDIAFEPGPDGLLSLRILVPDAHPTGRYVGAVVDAGTGQARGTLDVTLG